MENEELKPYSHEFETLEEKIERILKSKIKFLEDEIKKLKDD